VLGAGKPYFAGPRPPLRLAACDLIVEDVVFLELKAARALESAHEAQLLHYLRATEIEVGLLLNFGLRPQFRRVLFDNERKRIRGNPCESVAKVSA